MSARVATHKLSAPDFSIEKGDVAVSFEGALLDAVSATGPAVSGQSLIMPPLVNAHDHGYGIPTLAIGAPDDALECWIPGLANRPETDPELEALVAFGRMALAGIGTTVHCHNSGRRDRLTGEAHKVAAAAHKIGLRVAFSCPVADRNPVIYGDHAELGEVVSGQPGSGLSGADQIDNAVSLWRELGGPTFNVQLGPIGPQWCQLETLERIAETSAATGMRVHMHLLETERQRHYLDEDWPEGPVAVLDRIGLLSPRLTVAHGVWLRKEECETLAARGVTVSVNSSSNLRLRSGIAPVASFIDSGLNFALGLDGSGFDDDQDMFRELRLFQRLQSGFGLNHAMPTSRLLKAALQSAYRSFDGSDDYGALMPGARADILRIDLARILADVVNDGDALTELVIARAQARDVLDLQVAGRAVVRDRSLVDVDFEAAVEELSTQASATFDRPGSKGRARLREAIRDFYSGVESDRK